MRRHPILHRIALVGLAIFQMAAPSLASVADARLLERNDRIASRSHIEDHTRRSCAAIDPDECGLCQFLSHLAAEPAKAQAQPPVSRDQPSLCASAPVAAVADGRNPTSIRAPPVG